MVDRQGEGDPPEDKGGHGRLTRSKSLRGLGAKYGGTLRKRYSNIHRTLKAKKECPSCSNMRLKRVASGIWKCASCGYTVAGGAYDVSPTKAQQR
jgi:large subunit ribosomal protein L37Ae